MKKLLAILLIGWAGIATAQQLTSLSDLNVQTVPVPSVDVARVPTGSGSPLVLTSKPQSQTYDTAYPVAQNLYQVPGFMPYFPSAGTIWPRVVRVHCRTANDCDGYNITPSLGRGEYIYVQPVIDEPVLVKHDSKKSHG